MHTQVKSRSVPKFAHGPRAVPATADDAPPASRPWLALAVLATAQFMVFLDETVVNVALPSIKEGLGFSTAGLAWTIDAYIVVFGGLLLLGGRLADTFGRRRMFLTGTLLFGLASLLDGLAQTRGVFIGARALQGVGAALSTPAALALASTVFVKGRERERALAFWGTLAGLGFVVGVLLGGVITDAASWRWVFLINVPVAIGALIAVPRVVAESRATPRPRVSVAGAALSTAGVITVVFGLLRTQQDGWAGALPLGSFAVGALLLIGFTAVERRGSAPLIPSRLLRNRSSMRADVLQAVMAASLISSFFLLTLFLQQVLGYSPMKAGLGYLPMAIMVIVGGAAGDHLIESFGPARSAGAGLAVSTLSLVLMSQLSTSSSYATDVLPALVLLGLGAGIAFPSITAAALATVRRDDAGLASGLLQSFAQLGGAVGVGVLTAIATSRTSDAVATGSTPSAAMVDGFTAAFVAGAILAGGGALLGLLARRPGSEHRVVEVE